MTWQDDLQPASFRGVPFGVTSIVRSQELAADLQVFPGRARAGDAAHVEPLGLGPRRFKVAAFVWGPEYREARDALEEALHTPGPGRLVHPYRGELTVSILGRIDTTETPKRGGLALVSFEAVVTSEPTLRRGPDTAAVMQRDLDAFLEDAARDFDDSYDTEGVPDFAKAKSVDAFADAVEALQDARAQLAGAVGTVTDAAADVGAFAGELASFASAPSSAARSLISAVGSVAALPGRVEGAVVDAVSSTRTIADDLLDAFDPLMRFGDGFASILETTLSRQSETRLRRAVAQTARAAALGHAARAVAALPFTSRAHALEVRLRLAASFDDLVDASSAGGDTASGARFYEALRRARTSTIEHLSAVASTLPETTVYEVPSPLPALVVAHLIYADATRAEEIIARNAIGQPGRIEAGVELEVLRG